MIAIPEFDGKWVELANRAIFRIGGPDRVRYLNGQVTNDVSGPLEEKSVGACLCSLKGKVEFLVWISASGDDLILDGQLDQREDLAARLDRYLIADDCEIDDITDEYTIIHHFSQEMPGVPSNRVHLEGFDFLKLKSAISELSGEEISLAEFERAQSLSGVPMAPWEITGNEFPAELRIDSWTVDFNKGCYLGQEVISRIKSVGKVKRELTLVFAESNLPQDSLVRTEAGRTGKIIRQIEAGAEKKYVAFCLLGAQPKSTLGNDFQPVTELSMERSLG